MGCCTIKCETSKFDSISLETKPREELPTQEFTNEKPEDIYALVQTVPRLLCTKGWSISIQNGVTIKVKSSEWLKSGPPIVHSYFSIPYRGSHHSIVKLLLDPMYRIQWDSSVVEMDVLSILSNNKMIQRVLQNNGEVRERVEKVIVIESPKKTTLVSQSLHPISSGMADVKFFLMDIADFDDNIVVEITSKIDWQLPRTFRPTDFFINWIACFKQAVETNLKSESL